MKNIKNVDINLCFRKRIAKIMKIENPMQFQNPMIQIMVQNLLALIPRAMNPSLISISMNTAKWSFSSDEKITST